MLVKTYAAALQGINALTVTVETVVQPGVMFCIVGLPDTSVKESQERVRAAITQSGYKMPRMSTVINLAPADVRKEGSAYALPIAVSLLVGSGLIKTAELDKYMIMGELSLDGSVMAVKGVFLLVLERLKA